MPVSTDLQPAPVLVVGAGPTGCTLALLLARAGIPVTIVEQNAEPQQHPAACILSTRTMEIFRELGLADEIVGACQDIFEHGNITWVVSLAGRELGRLSAVGKDRERLQQVSPTHTVKFPQHKLEPLLWRRLETHPAIEFRRNCEFIDMRQAPDTVTATVVERSSGRRADVQTPYLVACDGVSSAIRRCVGISMDGPVLQHMMGIHFLADLTRYVAHRPSILYWVLNRDLMGVLIAHWFPTEWVLFTPYFPPQEAPESFTASVCRSLIERAVGVSVPEMEIKHIRPWALAAKRAGRFRQGRVFLAGDAAHCFPPTGGLGLNTGMHDAHNLAWKLAAVIKNCARSELLDTYELERRPVAKVNVEHSVRNFEKMSELTSLVGLNWQQLRLLAGIQNSSLFRYVPEKWQSAFVKIGVKHALRRLGRLDQDGPDGDRLRCKFRQILPGQEPHYRFVGLDLGFLYSQGAVISETGSAPRATDPVTDYLPTTWPGARLPHLWVQNLDGRRALFDFLNGTDYLLLVQPTGKSAWKHALEEVQRDFRTPVRLLAISSTDNGDVLDPEDRWQDLSETEPDGAVLTRPDGHVAWRCRQLPPDPAAILRTVLADLWSAPQKGARSASEGEPPAAHTSS